MSIATDRIHNYYQFADAEVNFYRLSSSKEDNISGDGSKEEKAPEVVAATVAETNQEPKSKKAKKNRKKESSTSDSKEIVVENKQSGSEKPNNVVVQKQETKEDDTSARTDSGIAEVSESSAQSAKKKSRSKRQREKKAAAAAAAAHQDEQIAPASEAQSQPKKESESATAALAQAPPAAVAAAAAPETSKAKDNKKKKTKNSAEHKTASKQGEDKNGVTSTSTLATEIAKARQHIKSSLERVDGVANFNMPGSELLERISLLEKDNSQLRGLVDGLQNLVISLESRLNKLDGGSNSSAKPAAAPSKPAPAATAADDDDVDLFGSDEEEDAEAEKIKEERVKAYAEKKSKKPVLIAKSSILLDVKPWDDETDMKEMEKNVRTIEMDGLLWGASKLIPLAYGIKKLQIMCVIEDEKVSVDELTEKIEMFEDFVQSVDIAAFNKI